MNRVAKIHAAQHPVNAFQNNQRRAFHEFQPAFALERAY
jgi:hypothetical protein